MSPRISKVYDDHEARKLGFFDDEDEEETDWEAAREDHDYEMWSDE